MIYRVNYNYSLGSTGPYKRSILIEADTLAQLEMKFNLMREKNYPNFYFNDKKEKIDLCPSGTIESVIVEGSIENI